jgi:hypothetical protein
MRVQSVEYIGQPGGKYKITCLQITLVSLLSHLLFRDVKERHEVRTFVGDCTVWHELPHFRRPGTLTEGMLADALNRAQFEGTV